MSEVDKVVCLSGGVGGARFLHGVAQALAPEQLTAVVNTGDDFSHWGLTVCPDLDTVMYTLGGHADEARGWGLADESFRTLEQMRKLGAPAWFALGDKDLATHLVRTEALRRGQSLTEVTAELCAAFGVKARVLPMCDAPRPTLLDTFAHGVLPFQRWLVECGAPPVRAVQFSGEHQASPQVLDALAQADLVLIGPSNPYVSIDPILTLAGVRACLSDKCVVAVSPIVHGRAVKGPLAHMLESLSGARPSAYAVAQHYGDLLRGFVVEEGDQGAFDGLPVLATRTVMGGAADRLRLAREVLAFAQSLR